MRHKKLVYIILFIIFLSIIGIIISKKIKSVQRDIPSLLNFYNQYKENKPWQAKEALDLILLQEPNNLSAIYKLSTWYLQQGDTHSALEHLEKNHQRFPNDPQICLDLAQLYIMMDKKELAKPLIKQVMISDQVALQKKASALYQSNFVPSVDSTEITNYISRIEPIHWNNKEDLTPLFNKAMEIINLQPNEARSYLLLIIKRNPNYKEAYQTLGYLELKENYSVRALQYFLKAFSLDSQPKLALQIGYLYLQLDDKIKAEQYFEYALSHDEGDIHSQARQALAYLKSPESISFQQGLLVQAPLSRRDKLLMSFYEEKKKEPQKAWIALNTLLNLYPNDVLLLKEAAYFATAQNKNELAINLWKRLYFIESKPEYALNIGYLYDKLNKKIQAFQYFKLASKTIDPKQRYKAEIAMTNMGGIQTKFLPSPYFAEFYTAPFYFSRFDLGVLPIIAHAGKVVNQTYQTAVYLTYRRTKDNRSGTVQNYISQIFEDNVAIYGFGIRAYPFKTIPLLSFIEAGEAEDLVYRNRSKWRKDLRGGLVYYNAWGVKPDFSFHLEFPWKWRSTLYGDLIYYSRYNNNVIGTSWFRPGFRAVTLHSASLDVYLANYLILDTNHEFFNNTYSLGPGIAFQPSNHWNIVVRYESLQGYYIPVNSPTPNPYRSKYYNNVVFLEAFFTF
ncbi:Tetratricopeptide repeat protein [Legionella gratiana]|uniref:Tetratricopeptide repeat protein n=1 Tax=Legionella gratiana TaxID=45066 RepID=A0A378J3Y9_9GAMM|nr:tetratricopeptide repeat protein [Legionella gratiana]KTD14624.1 Tetratricopeptide repeat protein [Legionella gratiana]STX41681.1 Uncharacterized enzyme of heme biosynthesis [Legionella gratiana]